MKWFVAAAIGTVLMLATLLGCVSERVLTPEALLPAGAKEVMPPTDLVQDVVGKPMVGQFWMRGCTYDGGWDKLSAHIREQAEGAGYTKVYFHSEQVDKALSVLKCKSDDYMCVYKSAGNTVGVGAINLKLIRDKGGRLEGIAQYVLIGGLDLHEYSQTDNSPTGTETQKTARD